MVYIVRVRWGGNAVPNIESTLCIQQGSEFPTEVRGELLSGFQEVKIKVFKLEDGTG